MLYINVFNIELIMTIENLLDSQKDINLIPKDSNFERKSMESVPYLMLIGFLVFYFILQIWILPKMGVPT